MIFFKKSTIVLDCFTTNSAIAELFPVSFLREHMPTWWKEIPKSSAVGECPVEISTIKRCPGFRDLFKNTVCLPAWSQYKLYQDPTYGFSHVAPNRSADGLPHQEEQMAGAYPDYQHYKLISPWNIKEKSGVNFLMTQASWHTSNPCGFHIPTGVLEFKYQHSTHVNLVAPKQEKLKEHDILPGVPLVYLVPLTEKKIKINIEVVSQQEMNKLDTYHHSFYNSYEITKKILKDKK